MFKSHHKLAPEIPKKTSCKCCFPARHVTPLEKYYPRLMVCHQSWFLQRSKIQLLGLNIVCLSLQQRPPFSTDAHGPFTSVFEGNRSSSTSGLDHSLLWLLSQPRGSKCSSGCSCTIEQLLQEVWQRGRAGPGGSEKEQRCDELE